VKTGIESPLIITAFSMDRIKSGTPITTEDGDASNTD
jgi:hypothetical protein